MPNYILGNKPPIINADTGSGGWCDPIPSPEAMALKLTLEAMLSSTDKLSIFPSAKFITRKVMPDAAQHMNHYLGNTGKPFNVDMKSYIERSDTLHAQYLDEIKAAKIFAQSLPPGKFSITSSREDWGSFRQSKNPFASLLGESDLFFAVGGYKYWGQADVSITKEKNNFHRCEMIFWFHFYDRYNWDKKKSVEVFGVHVMDETLQQLHHHCLAKEFDIKGMIESEISWVYIPAAGQQTGNSNRVGELRSDRVNEKYSHDPDRDTSLDVSHDLRGYAQ